MRSIRFIVFPILLVLAALIGCSGDSGTKSDGGDITHEGVYASLVVGRMIGMVGSIIRIDQAVARFDSVYSCDPVQPLRPDSVYFEEDTMHWMDQIKMYYWPDLVGAQFIDPGHIYNFHVYGNAALPLLIDSISFPSGETYVVSPEYDSTLSKSGFNVIWAGSGSGGVRLILLSAQGDSAVAVNTENDGLYSFSGAQLGALPTGDYGIILINEAVKYIEAPGYDSRSYLRARIMSTTAIHLE